MPHVFIVDAKKWEEAQKVSREFWESEEGQKCKQEMRACAARFDELIRTGKTTVKIVTNKEDEIKMKSRIDKKISKLGFVKTEENDLCVIYKRNTDGYQHVVALLHKTSGNHLIQSYDPTLCDKNGIGNTAVGLTYKENMLFLKKMRKLGWG